MIQTVETIIEEMQGRVRNNEPISPASWLEAAQRVNLLRSEIDNKIAHYEAEMNEIKSVYLKQDMSSAKAKILAQSEIDYEDYLKTKSNLDRIVEWVRIAKKRVEINEF